jgi:hypothetical protein
MYHRQVSLQTILKKKSLAENTDQMGRHALRRHPQSLLHYSIAGSGQMPPYFHPS